MSPRHYWCDGLFVCCVWCVNTGRDTYFSNWNALTSSSRILYIKIRYFLMPAFQLSTKMEWKWYTFTKKILNIAEFKSLKDIISYMTSQQSKKWIFIPSHVQVNRIAYLFILSIRILPYCIWQTSGYFLSKLMTYFFPFGKVIGAPVSVYWITYWVMLLKRQLGIQMTSLSLCQPGPVINIDYSRAWVSRILGWTLFHLLSEWQIRSWLVLAVVSQGPWEQMGVRHTY